MYRSVCDVNEIALKSQQNLFSHLIKMSKINIVQNVIMKNKKLKTVLFLPYFLGEFWDCSPINYHGTHPGFFPLSVAARPSSALIQLFSSQRRKRSKIRTMTPQTIPPKRSASGGRGLTSPASSCKNWKPLSSGIATRT